MGAINMKLLKQFVGIWTLEDTDALIADVLGGFKGGELPEMLRAHIGALELVKARVSERKIKLIHRRIPEAARLIAGEIHSRGQKAVARSSTVLKGVPRARKEGEFLVVHNFVWGQELAEQIISQAWGKLGEARKGWVAAEERSRTDQFGVDVEFEALFVRSHPPLYELAEKVGGPWDGVIYKRRSNSG